MRSETYCEDIACPDCTTLHLVDCALDATCRARQHIFGFPQLGRPQVKSKGPFSREADPQSRAPGLQVEQRRDHGMRLLRGWTSRSPPPLRENWQVNPRSSALLQTLKPRDPRTFGPSTTWWVVSAVRPPRRNPDAQAQDLEAVLEALLIPPSPPLLYGIIPYTINTPRPQDEVTPRRGEVTGSPWRRS